MREEQRVDVRLAADDFHQVDGIQALQRTARVERTLVMNQAWN